jgi:SpoVK/Ycf46/Vps4 family AAA+-type ATPase
LRRLFDFVRTHPCVLFFDEFDTLGKERGDVHETGEIKRVVSSLLLQIDALPSYVVVVTATNHPELLDRAVWRRFQMRLELPAPTSKQTQAWLKRLEMELGWPLGFTHTDLIRRLRISSYAELEDFSLDVRRRMVLAGSDADLKRIVRERTAEWSTRFRPKRNLTAKTRGRT